MEFAALQAGGRIKVRGVGRGTAEMGGRALSRGAGRTGGGRAGREDSGDEGEGMDVHDYGEALGIQGQSKL